MPTDFFLCGRWDGANLWTQWHADSPQEIEHGYELHLRYGAPGSEEWGAWQRIGGERPMQRYWIVVPTWKEGHRCQARLRPFGSSDDAAWITAREVEFNKSTCLFEISSTTKALSFPRGHLFARIVDGASCAYALAEPVELLAGGDHIEVTLTANVSSGYHQLDYENHFDLSPSLGVRIRNLAPSQADVTGTGRDYTVLSAVLPDGPMVAAFGARNF